VTRALPVIGIALSACLVIAVISLGIYSAYRDYHQCVDNGGHFERRNCREVDDQICTTTDYGGGMVITTCFPTTTTVCDRVCVGASAEAR
jgi:hypothetical protein